MLSFHDVARISNASIFSINVVSAERNIFNPFFVFSPPQLTSARYHLTVTTRDSCSLPFAGQCAPPPPSPRAGPALASKKPRRFHVAVKKNQKTTGALFAAAGCSVGEGEDAKPSPVVHHVAAFYWRIFLPIVTRVLIPREKSDFRFSRTDI